MSMNTQMVSQRMDAMQAMHSGNFLTYSYVLADNPNQVSQVYNAPFQQNIHHDAGKWHEAKVKNPDSQLAYPQPVYGFSALSERTKQQKAHLANLVAATDLAKTEISNLTSHTERLILTELGNCEKRNNQLSLQLSKLMLQIEAYALQTCKASVDYNHHRELLEKLERVSSVLVGVQKKMGNVRQAYRDIEQAAGSMIVTHSSTPPTTSAALPNSSANFISLKDSLNARFDAIYSAVLDRCKSVSSAAIHERLNRRSNDYLSELKRQYISAGDTQPMGAIESTSSVPLKFRTMNSFEIASNRLLSLPTSDPIGLMSEISQLCNSPSVLNDIWTLVGHFCATSRGNYLRASIEFLESKFASEITAGFHDIAASRVSKLSDKKQVLYSYCRQRITVRSSGDSSWIWFSVYCGFRSGWSSILTEISMEKSSNIPGLALVVECLVKLLESRTSVDVRTRLNSIIDERNDDPYKTLVIAICKCEYNSVRLSQLVTDVTAYDWVWFSLREIVDSGDSSDKLVNRLREKIDSLPKNYFLTGQVSTGLYPSLGPSLLTRATVGPGTASSGVHAGKSTEESRALVQMSLMHFLVLNFERGVEIGLKTANEVFDINSPYHRCLLFCLMALDKFNVHTGAVGIVVEAALSISDPKEREIYAGGLSSESSQKYLETLRALDKRRQAA